METILEQQRRYHEEKERLMDVMAKEMLTKKSTVSGAWARATSRLGPVPVFNLGELSLALRPFPLRASCSLRGSLSKLRHGYRPRRRRAPRGLGCSRWDLGG